MILDIHRMSPTFGNNFFHNDIGRSSAGSFTRHRSAQVIDDDSSSPFSKPQRVMLS